MSSSVSQQAEDACSAPHEEDPWIDWSMSASLPCEFGAVVDLRARDGNITRGVRAMYASSYKKSCDAWRMSTFTDNDGRRWYTYSPFQDGPFSMPCQADLHVEQLLKTGTILAGRARELRWGGATANVKGWRMVQQTEITQPDLKAWITLIPGATMPCAPHACVDIRKDDGSIMNAMLAKHVSWDLSSLNAWRYTTIAAGALWWRKHRTNNIGAAPCATDEMVQALRADDTICEARAGNVSWGPCPNCVVGWWPVSEPRVLVETPVTTSQEPATWTPRTGDVVQLKSGGMFMTVVGMKSSSTVDVCWMDAQGALRETSCLVACLKPCLKPCSETTDVT